MKYFGTSPSKHGHYIWELNDRLNESKMAYSEIPFDPYAHKGNPKGKCVFVQTEKYSVLHIAGSPKDTRFGTVSVFWIDESLSANDFLARLDGNEVAMWLISCMPFPVDLITILPNPLPVFPVELKQIDEKN